MFGELFNLAIDVVTLPVNIVASVTDTVTDGEINEIVEDIKNQIKIE